MSDLYDHWYSTKWKVLTSNLGNLCWQELQVYLASNSIKSLIENEWLFQEYIYSIREQISLRIHSSDKLWNYALPLFVDVEKLRFMLLTDVKRNNYLTTASYLAPFKTVLNQYLEQSRREIVSQGIGDSDNRLRNWERLDKINRSLLAKNKQSKSFQYQIEHAEYVASYIKEHHPNDKNLPRRADKVLDYLYKFDPPLESDVEDLYLKHDDFNEQNCEEFLPDLLPILQECVEQRLSDEEQGIVQEYFGVESRSSNVVNLSKYKMKKALDSKILKILRECLEYKTQGLLDY